MLDCVHDEICASKQRMHEQREMCLTGGNIPHQMGADNVNISYGLNTDDTLDLFCISNNDPRNVADAMRHSDWPEWQVSMGEELTSLKEHCIWTLILCDQVPNRKQIIPLKFMLQYKLDEKDDISHHKSHVIQALITMKLMHLLLGWNPCAPSSMSCYA